MRTDPHGRPTPHSIHETEESKDVPQFPSAPAWFGRTRRLDDEHGPRGLRLVVEVGRRPRPPPRLHRRRRLLRRQPPPPRRRPPRRLLRRDVGRRVAASAGVGRGSAPVPPRPAELRPAAAGGGTIKKGLKVYFIPKDTQNPYEVIADNGGKAALTELGGTVTVSSGTADTAAAQIPSIQAAIQQKADAIVIAGNDPSALCPSLAQAVTAGIKIVSFDSDVTCPNHLFINQANTEQIGTSEVDLLAKQIGSKGDIAILSAAATATNQNAWIGYMKQELKKYPNMKLVDTVYGNDDPATSLTVLQGLLTNHPNLRGIISPTTVGIKTVAQYLQKHPALKGKLTLTGLGLPSDMKPYIHDGTVESFELWNPKDLGYLAGYAAAALASGVINGTAGSKFTAGRLKGYTVLPRLPAPPVRRCSSARRRSSTSPTWTSSTSSHGPRTSSVARRPHRGGPPDHPVTPRPCTADLIGEPMPSASASSCTSPWSTSRSTPAATPRSGRRCARRSPTTGWRNYSLFLAARRHADRLLRVRRPRGRAGRDGRHRRQLPLAAGDAALLRRPGRPAARRGHPADPRDLPPRPDHRFAHPSEGLTAMNAST